MKNFRVRVAVDYDFEFEAENEEEARQEGWNYENHKMFAQVDLIKVEFLGDCDEEEEDV